MRMLTRKRSVVLAAIGVLAASGVAFAFWTTTGSGSGSGSVTESNGTIVLTGTVSSPLFPGGSAPVMFRAINAGATDLQVQTVSLVSISTDPAHAGCDMSAFSMPPAPQNVTVQTGSNDFMLPNPGTLSFANSLVNQDACKGAPLMLTLASN
jgi:hypothetical protein